MAFLETVKAAAQVVIEAVKANPLAATGIAVGTGATIGGGIYLRRRYKAKQELKVDAPALTEEAVVAAAGDIVAAAAATVAAATQA